MAVGIFFRYCNGSCSVYGCGPTGRLGGKLSEDFRLREKKNFKGKYDSQRAKHNRAPNQILKRRTVVLTRFVLGI